MAAGRMGPCRTDLEHRSVVSRIGIGPDAAFAAWRRSIMHGFRGLFGKVAGSMAAFVVVAAGSNRALADQRVQTEASAATTTLLRAVHRPGQGSGGIGTRGP